MKTIFLGLLGMMAFSQAAIASGHIVSSSGAKSFVFTGLTPNQTHSVRIMGWPRDRNFSPNACGLTIIKPSFKAVILQLAFPASSLIDVGSLPTQSLPTCSGGQLSELRSVNFKTPEGSVVLVNQSGSVRVIEDITKSVKSNACGNAKLNPPKSTFFNGWWFEGTSFQIGNQTVYADDLLSTLENSICRKVGGNFVKYVPLSP
ncbi:MAG: hypothetical protein ACRCT1_18530 [Microcoleaceae cyanobacterium]